MNLRHKIVLVGALALGSVPVVYAGRSMVLNYQQKVQQRLRETQGKERQFEAKKQWRRQELLEADREFDVCEKNPARIGCYLDRVFYRESIQQQFTRFADSIGKTDEAIDEEAHHQ